MFHLISFSQLSWETDATTHPVDGEIEVIAIEAMDSEFSKFSPASHCIYPTCSPLLISHGSSSVLYRCEGRKALEDPEDGRPTSHHNLGEANRGENIKNLPH